MNRRLGRAMAALPAILLGGTIVLAQESRQAPSLTHQPWESCAEMHDDYVQRFESSPGFGLSRMARPLMLDRSRVLDSGRTQYALTSVELVGLLKLDTPVVHVPSWHGARPAAFTSRDLTDFEKTTLTSFRAGKGLASVGDDSSALQCMGALRAKDSCISCHRDKKPGDLLGAFTYRLAAMRSPHPLQVK